MFKYLIIELTFAKFSLTSLIKLTYVFVLILMLKLSLYCLQNQ